MRIVIDRFEGDFAVCEYPDGRMKNILLVDLPINAREGEVLVESGGEYVLDSVETESRRERIKQKADKLFD